MKKLKIIIVLLLFSSLPATAAFLGSLPSSRAAGKGGAFAAGADDVSAGAWNPARLASLRHPEAMFDFYKPFAGLKGVNIASGYGGIAYPLADSRALGLSYSYFYGGGAYSESSAILSGAATVSEEIKAGANIKYLYAGYNWDGLQDPIVREGEGSGAVTFDLGLSYDFNPYARSAFVLRNILPADIALQEKNRVPFEAVGAFAVNMPPAGEFAEIIPEISIEYRDQSWGEFSDKINYSLGIEGWTSGRDFGLRCGINKFEAALGGSYLAEVGGILLRFDYTALFPFSELASHMGHHRFSVSLKKF